MAALPKPARPKTAQTCIVSGLYVAICCRSSPVALRSGDEYPPCPRCSEPVRWMLVALPPAPLTELGNEPVDP